MQSFYEGDISTPKLKKIFLSSSNSINATDSRELDDIESHPNDNEDEFSPFDNNKYHFDGNKDDEFL